MNEISTVNATVLHGGCTVSCIGTIFRRLEDLAARDAPSYEWFKCAEVLDLVVMGERHHLDHHEYIGDFVKSIVNNSVVRRW